MGLQELQQTHTDRLSNLQVPFASFSLNINDRIATRLARVSCPGCHSCERDQSYFDREVSSLFCVSCGTSSYSFTVQQDAKFERLNTLQIGDDPLAPPSPTHRPKKGKPNHEALWGSEVTLSAAKRPQRVAKKRRFYHFSEDNDEELVGATLKSAIFLVD